MASGLTNPARSVLDCCKRAHPSSYFVRGGGRRVVVTSLTQRGWIVAVAAPGGFVCALTPNGLEAHAQIFGGVHASEPRPRRPPRPRRRPRKVSQCTECGSDGHNRATCPRRMAANSGIACFGCAGLPHRRPKKTTCPGCGGRYEAEPPITIDDVLAMPAKAPRECI